MDMLNITLIIAGLVFGTSFTDQRADTYSLKVEVRELRNSKGMVQFALYNYEGSIPDEHYKKQFKLLRAAIQDGASYITFTGLPPGRYAVNILHDENNNGKIDKGLILPKEGIGFSNMQSIGFGNKPSFAKASFALEADSAIVVKVIYM